MENQELQNQIEELKDREFNNSLASQDVLEVLKRVEKVDNELILSDEMVKRIVNEVEKNNQVNCKEGEDEASFNTLDQLTTIRK